MQGVHGQAIFLLRSYSFIVRSLRRRRPGLSLRSDGLEQVIYALKPIFGPGKVFTGQIYVEKLEPKHITRPYPIVFIPGAGQTGTVWRPSYAVLMLIFSRTSSTLQTVAKVGHPTF